MYNKKEVLQKVDMLYNMWKEGSLGGEVMPEDANPHLEKSSMANYLYFTLPMALNYQRNSYKLWESALNTYNDKETNFVFNPKICINKTFEEVQYALVKYKVALQKQKQTEIWLFLCKTFVELYDGDIRKLFDSLDNDVDKIRNFIQKENKKRCSYDVSCYSSGYYRFCSECIVRTGRNSFFKKIESWSDGAERA